ncbi:MAG: hypothetical protein KA184_14625 [Candidatus Hydrogenedentes bacterium]|nr:hypothetical protein [Candidatus Hydrogenedentota bacterium]
MRSPGKSSEPRADEGRLRLLALYGLAFAWPWCVYETLPGVFIPCSALFAAALVFAACRDVLRGRKVILPFELAWPLVVLVALAVAHDWRAGAMAWSPSAAGGALLFASVLQTIRSRGAVRQCVWLSALSGGMAALFSLFVHFRPFYGWVLYSVFPTAFSPGTGATLAFAATLEEGALVLVLCLTLALGAAFAPEHGHWRRTTAFLAIAPITAALAVLARLSAPDPGLWRPPAPWRQGPLSVLAALVVLWLLARIAAKAWVGRGEGVARLHGMLSAMALCGGAMVVLLPETPRLGYAFLLALAGGHAFAQTEEARTAAPGTAWFCLLLLPLIAWNVLHVDVRNGADPRNYEAAAAACVEHGLDVELSRRFAFINERSPVERRTHYWQARGYLARKWPDAAATAFCMAMTPPPAGRALLPPPSEEQTGYFLDRLRDLCSALPLAERGLAYERALVAAGRADDALASLRFRAEKCKGVSCPASPLAMGMADLLGDARLAGTLATWSAGELVCLFEQAGAHVGPAPDGFPARYLPAVGIADRDPERMSVRAYAGGMHAGVRGARMSSAQILGAMFYWRNPRRLPRPGWVWRVTVERGEALAEVRFEEALSCSLAPPNCLYDPPAAFVPAIGVLIP